jgi:hypothetical protein
LRRALAAALVACCVALAAACGGGSDDASTAATAPAPPPEAGLEALLPPEDAIAGLRPGEVRELPTPRAFVDALYQIGEPGRGPARRRLAEGGYADGVLRDQIGRDPSAGPVLVRAYAIRMRDEDSARQEVAAAAAEVLATPLGEASAIDVPGIEGARAARVEVSQGGITGSALFVTFPEGPDVYGIQAVSQTGAELPEGEVVAAAQEQAARVRGVP